MQKKEISRTIVEAYGYIQRYVEGFDQFSLLIDKKTKDAVSMRLQQVLVQRRQPTYVLQLLNEIKYFIKKVPLSFSYFHCVNNIKYLKFIDAFLS